MRIININKSKTVEFINRHLFKLLGGGLALLLVLIVVGYFIRQDGKEEVQERPVNEVTVFQIGEVPRITVTGQATKDNVVTVVAQTGGVVQRIYTKEGDKVWRGKNLVYLSSNYQGGSALTLQRQIAERQYNHTKDTYDLQKDIVAKQRDLAEKSKENTDELRDIQEQSISETRSAIDLNEEIIDNLNETIETSTSDSVVESTKQLKSSYLSGLNQLKSSLRNLEYQTDDNNPPVKLAETQKDLTLKQLELQEKSLDLGKEISLLQLRLAQINESLAYPSTPIAGVVQKVHVNFGQAVQPGTPLVTIAGEGECLKIQALVSRGVAGKVSEINSHRIKIDNEWVEVMPTFVSTEATDMGRHTITYNLDAEAANKIGNRERVEISLPIGYPDSNGVVPFIPIDAVYQTEDRAYVFVVDGEEAKSQEVRLGEVYGRFVVVEEGIEDSTQVILDRNVVGSEKIDVKN